MDDEDSQDELINKNASHGKGKRPATSIFSDEEENSEDGEDSQAGETDSEDGEDDASEDGEEEDGEEESEHEGAEKDLEGAVGSTSADLACLSSDEDAEKCPICLNSFHEQPVATPESCEHYFCLDCILEWAKNANSCPVDRIVFSNILLRKCYGGKVQKTITVKKTEKATQEEQVNVDLEQTSCEVCGGSDREDRLLLCDGCDAGYHMECLTPPLNAVPVEEWFCPECAPNARNERSSEDESNVLPTTSRFQPSNSRPTRAIARTQHSERVRRNVNRHRITQARTAAQLAPRYLMQSTWLDETINAVVAGLNTAVYMRDLTPRPRSRRRRKPVRRRKTKKDGKASEGKKSSTGIRRRKRRMRRTKSRKKLVVKKTTTRGRIAHNLGIKKPVRSSSIPSVYRPSEHTLGSMRADIGAASLSIYGDPFDLDPFDDQNEEVQQTSTPSSLLEAKRRGLSRSAMRSHQPVARPISAGLPRHGHSIPQIEEVTEAAPVPDLLGSILSGQSMLLMDSSDIVINRDGSLKATKPVNMSLQRSISNGSTSAESGITSAGASPSVHQPIRQTTPSSSSSASLRRPSSHSPSPTTPVSPPPPLLHTPAPVLGHPRLHTPMPHRPMPSQPTGTEHSLRGTCGVRGEPSTRVPSGASDSRHRERVDTSQQIPAKKPPPKPVWVDVSVLPRIPKIKRESSLEAQSSRGSNSNNLPESSMTSLAGDKGRQHTVDQQRASASRHRTADSHRQRLDRPGPSSSFSNSFSTSSSSSSVTSNARPSSSSAISFRINTSGNPWHARRLSAPEPSGAKDKESAKRTQKDKQTLLLSHSQAKKASVKSEVYDPFDPTGSDSSESETENDCPEMDFQSTASMPATMGQNEGGKLQIKTEPMVFDTPHLEESSGMCIQVKKEPPSFKEDPCQKPLDNFATGHRQMQSESLAAVMAYSESPAISDTERSASPESPYTIALERSRSSSTSSQHSAEKFKIEIKDETEDELSPVKSTSEPEVPKGNGLCDEVPSVASSSDVIHKSKEKEINSPCSQPEEERVQTEPASQSSLSKDLESSAEENECSWSEDRKRSSSRSPGCRRSRSRSEEKRRSRSRSKERRHSRSRSKEKRRSRSRSKEKRRSRSRSKEKRHSRSGSKEKRRSRSRSKEKRRSRSRSKGKRRSRSRSKDRRHSCSRSPVRRRSRSKSKERRRSRSRSRDKRRSRSRSKEKRRSRSRSKEKRRSRSKERKHSRSQDKRRSARSSSDESSRKKKAKHTSRDRYDGKGKDGNKRSKDKMRSPSRSRSRSIERRREQPFSHRSSTASKDGSDMKSKRRRSRSSSRERRRRVDVSSSERKSKAFYQRERSTNKPLVSPSVEAKEPNYSLKKNAVALKKETEFGENQYETGISVVSIKKEKEISSLALIDKTDKITKETLSVNVSNKPHVAKAEEIKLENACTLSDADEVELQKDIKIETEQSNTLFEELKKPEEIKKEEITISGVPKTSQEFNEISVSKAFAPSIQASHSLHQEGKGPDYILEPAKQVKIKQIWPNEDDCGEDDDPYSDGALVINVSTPDPAPVVCYKEAGDELLSMPVVVKEEMELVPLQTPCPVKQEPVDSSDEDINVDFLIDNLDFIKKELKEEGSVTDSPGDTVPHPSIQEVSGGVKQEIESALVMGGTKAKSQGKRVTWNIQEPEGPPPEKMSKLALFKLKLKQEGSRKAASITSTQSSSQEAASVQVGSKPAATSLNPPLEEGESDLIRGGSKSSKEDVPQDLDQKDKYMKKLHMQERAVEEVKLAIKPFYQKRDITKEEYKEILRKAVQKVCHSKSGEINPVKVANLVKAYVDKYKHARKHRKGESLGQIQNTEGPKDSETPG